jgi:hypothetical protein
MNRDEMLLQSLVSAIKSEALFTAILEKTTTAAAAAATTDMLL